MLSILSSLALVIVVGALLFVLVKVILETFLGWRGKR